MVNEIKGYKTEQSEEKRKQNPDIKFLYQKDIQYCLDYTINKYGKEYWNKLVEIQVRILLFLRRLQGSLDYLRNS